MLQHSQDLVLALTQHLLRLCLLSFSQAMRIDDLGDAVVVTSVCCLYELCCVKVLLCAVPKYQPGGFCPILPYDGQLCASSQPAWSAFREPTYGHGTLTFMNETTAFWRWNRNLDNEAVVGDSVYIIREMTCQNKASYAASAPATANVTATAG